MKNKNKFYKLKAIEEISDPSKQHKKWKRGNNNNWYHRTTKEKKNHKNIMNSYINKLET